jgi:hypothetical protein
MARRSSSDRERRSPLIGARGKQTRYRRLADLRRPPRYPDLLPDYLFSVCSYRPKPSPSSWQTRRRSPYSGQASPGQPPRLPVRLAKALGRKSGGGAAWLRSGEGQWGVDRFLEFHRHIRQEQAAIASRVVISLPVSNSVFVAPNDHRSPRLQSPRWFQ